MNKLIISIIVILVIAAGVGAYFVFQKSFSSPVAKCGDGICQSAEKKKGTCPEDCKEEPGPGPVSEIKDILFFDFHAGLMAGDPLLFSGHPLVEGVMFGAKWPEVEPQKGVFNFSSLDKNIDNWTGKGKSIVIGAAPYGQTRGNDVTPSWIYDTVPSIKFTSHKESRGDITIPKVWDDRFLAEYEEFVKAFAQKYDSDPRVGYIRVGIGHIGYTNAQPSQEGAEAFLDAGWTLSVWQDYVKKVIDIYSTNFKNKKLILTIVPTFLRDRANLADNIETGKDIARYAANKGYYIAFVGVEADNQTFENTGIPSLVRDLFTLNLNDFAVGFGDDWPLYGPTGSKVRTAEDCQKILDNIYNLWSSANKKYPIFLKVLDNELAASEKGNKNFNQQVYDSLADFINKVKD